jgi:hypothetical protein
MLPGNSKLFAFVTGKHVLWVATYGRWHGPSSLEVVSSAKTLNTSNDSPIKDVTPKYILV